MPSDIIEPSGGLATPVQPLDDPRRPAVSAVPSEASDATSTSSDELTLSLTQARPDPLLGEFNSPDQAADAPSQFVPPAAEGAHPAESSGREKSDSSRAAALNALSALHIDDSDTGAALLGGTLSITSKDALSNLNLNMAPVPVPERERSPSHRPLASGSAENNVADDEDEDDLEPAKGTSLATLLLASYASAVTLGLVWVLWTGRRVRDDVSDFVPVADARTDPGARAGKSRRVAPPKPIPAEHFAELGKTIRLGSIEATPLAITTGTVGLERNFNGRETKSGGEKALTLTLRLKNVSPDVVLAPLDEAFVRDRINADPDSFIEAGPTGATIAMFPLAVESEWSIVGQSFRELQPGEAFESKVVSAPDAAGKLTSPMCWRVRLRTDINHTDDLGVRFLPEAVKPGP